MKKIVLIFAAMLTMAMSAVAASEAPAGDENEKTYQVSNPFSDDDENSTKHWRLETNGFYFGMGVNHSWDMINNSFEVGLLNALAVNYNSLHGQNISLGVGVNHKSYSVKRPNMLARNDNGAVVTVYYPTVNDAVNEIKDRSSNLNLWTVQFPLMFKQRIVKKLELGVAGILNWNTYARVDNHYEIDKVEHDTRYKGLKQNKVNFDAMGSLTWNGCGVYCRYSPGKFFKDGYGPEIKQTWTVGLALLF